MFYIYQILNLNNGKIYVGRTERPNKRWKEHQEVAKSNSYKNKKLIHKAITKYGVNSFEFRIIQVLESFNDAVNAEVYWIQYYKTNVAKYGNEFGYNLSDGGEGGGTGRHMSDATKQKISQTHKGKRKSLEQIKKWSLTKTQFSIEELEKIRVLLFQNISTYKIAEMFGCSQGVISEMKLGNSHLYFFTEQDIEQFKHRITKRGERNGAAKLTENKIKEIKYLIKQGVSTAKIAKIYNVGNSTILRIKNGQSWAYVE